MDELRLFWTVTAKKQRNHIFKHLNDLNKSNLYSKKLNNSIREITKLLKFHPKMGKEMGHKDMPAIAMEHYSILYRINPERIIIIAFWNNRQNPEKLLNVLKNNSE